MIRILLLFIFLTTSLFCSAENDKMTLKYIDLKLSFEKSPSGKTKSNPVWELNATLTNHSKQSIGFISLDYPNWPRPILKMIHKASSKKIHFQMIPISRVVPMEGFLVLPPGKTQLISKGFFELNGDKITASWGSDEATSITPGEYTVRVSLENSSSRLDGENKGAKVDEKDIWIGSLKSNELEISLNLTGD